MAKKKSGTFMKVTVVLLLLWLFVIIPVGAAAYQAVTGMEPIPTWGGILYGAGGMELAVMGAKKIADGRKAAAASNEEERKRLSAENKRLKAQLKKAQAALCGEQMKME